MSDVPASLNIEEENPTASNLEDEGTIERVPKKSKGKKKGKAQKKRRESIEEDDDDGEGSSRKKKGKGKKKAARKESDASHIQPEVVEVESDSKRLESNAGEASLLDETPRETVIEIKDEQEADELEEIVVKKEEASSEGENVVQEAAVTGESSGEEKTDEKKDSESEGTKEAEAPEGEGAVRRRATLSDIRGESVDKGDGEQSPAAATEVYLIITSC